MEGLRTAHHTTESSVPNPHAGRIPVQEVRVFGIVDRGVERGVVRVEMWERSRETEKERQRQRIHAGGRRVRELHTYIH